MFGELRDPVQTLHSRLRAHGKTMAVAESCTGGTLGGVITSVPGSSDVFMGGVIAYSNAIKRDLLDVPEPVLAEHGAVSEPAARHMAQGVVNSMGVSLGVSITGIAGPDGGTITKPVGTVYVGCSNAQSILVTRRQYKGDRQQIRWKSIQAAIDLALSRIES